MDRGVLEASALRDAFQQLEKDGPVETLDRILKWPVVAAAVKEGVVIALLCSLYSNTALLYPGLCVLR